MKINGNKLRKALRASDITQGQAASKLGIARQTLSVWVKSEELSPQIIQSVKTRLGIDLNEESQFLFSEPEVEYQKSHKGIPYYDVDVTAGNMQIFKGDSLEKPADYFYIPGFNDCTACVNVRGESMYSKYCAGDIIAIKHIEDTDVIQFGEAYVITTKEQNLFKYIRRNPLDDDTWLLESEYKDRYDSFPIKKEKVLNVFLVRGVVRAKTM